MIPTESSEEELEKLVDEGELSEAQALQKLAPEPRPARRGTSKDITQAHKDFIEKRLSEDAFYTILLRYIGTVVKSHSPNSGTFDKLEDCIQNAAIKIWKTLPKFDADRGGFARFVTVITLSEIRNVFDADRGRRVSLDEAETLQTQELSPEEGVLFKDWLNHLDDTDRSLARLLMDGLTQEEIGEALEISQPAVAQRLARIRRGKAPF